MKTIRLIIAALATCATFSAAHAQVSPSFTASPATACTGDTISIAVNSSAEYQTAKVDFGDGIDTYGDNLKHIYTKAGTYNITLTLLLKDNTWSQMATQTVTVGETPELTLENDPATALLTATTSSDATLEWSVGGNKMTNTAKTLYYLESGTYTVTASNSNGCSASQSLKVTYEKQTANNDTQIKVANNVITPGTRDGVNDVLYIEDVTNFTSPCSVKVFDKKGKLVYTNNNYSNTDGFQGRDDDGNELFAGTYYYVIKSQGKKGCTGFVDIIR